MSELTRTFACLGQDACVLQDWSARCNDCPSVVHAFCFVVSVFSPCIAWDHACLRSMSSLQGEAKRNKSRQEGYMAFRRSWNQPRRLSSAIPVVLESYSFSVVLRCQQPSLRS